MKVTAILKGLIDTNGHQPVQIRIYHEGKRTFHPTGIKLDPELFKEGKVLPAHPKAREHNEAIKKLIIKYQAGALEGFAKKTPRKDFYEYIEETLKHLERKGGTRRQYGSQITKLQEFAPTLYLHEITRSFLDRYKAFLKRRGNEGNTIWSSFKFIRTWVKMAYKHKLITDYPFDNYEFPKYIEPNKTYLSREEVLKIDKFCGDKKCPQGLMEMGTWFLISCYTGLRISDILQFDKRKNIIADRLVIKTEKTKEMVGLPLDARLKKYFKRIGYQKLSVHENTYNKSLKVLAAVAGVDKHISTHTGRHTAAMLLADAGVSQEVVAKILGHKDMRSTSTYFKISNARIDLELKKIK
jgi:site-specific recombinase XerD